MVLLMHVHIESAGVLTLKVIVHQIDLVYIHKSASCSVIMASWNCAELTACHAGMFWKSSETGEFT